MQSIKRLIYFVLLNILVTVITVWVVVTFMLRDFTPEQPASLGANPQTTAADGSGPLLVTQPPAQGTQDNGTAVSSLGQLEINTIIGAGDLETERVLIRHIGNKEVSLAGWQLKDEHGNVFSFPILTMFGGGAVTVYTQTGITTVVELYWGLDEAIWQPGEKATLVDPDGNVQATYTVP